MILDAKSGLRGTFRRADNQRLVRFIRWYNDADHTWEAFRCDPRVAKERGIPARSLLYRGRCRLIFTPAAPLDKKPAGRIAPSTPLDEIRREVLKGGEIKVTPLLAIPGVKPPECDGAKCHRMASWGVAVERLVEPELGDDGQLYERAVIVATSIWCDWCYRPPRQISVRGVETELENIAARPQ